MFTKVHYVLNMSFKYKCMFLILKKKFIKYTFVPCVVILLEHLYVVPGGCYIKWYQSGD